MVDPPSRSLSPTTVLNPYIERNQSSSHHPQHANFNSPLIASFISDHILAMSIECWCLTLYFFSGVKITLGWCYCVCLCGVYLYGTVGCVFIGFRHKDHQKRKGKKSEILDDLINISPIHSFVCVAFCFFFLCFLRGLCSHIS